MEFNNSGEVPINAFKLLGASTKRDDDTKIGFFGTGLKYAVAVLLREGIDFKVYSGLKEVEFKIRKTNFGKVKVGVITVNNEKTSMTTDAGINWEPWFAIREIYSNALDEGGTMELAEGVNPEAGTTKIYVKMDNKLGGITRDWQNFFSTKRTALDEFEVEHIGYRILEKRNDNKGLTVFRKGIRTYVNEHKQSLFDYDTTDLRINESRVAEASWEAYQRAAEALAQTSSLEVIKKFKATWAHGKYIEHDSSFWSYLFDWTSGIKFSDTWITGLEKHRLVPLEQSGFYGITPNTIGLPQTMLEYLYATFGDRLTIEGLSKTHYIKTGDYPAEFDKAFKILNAAGYELDKDDIIVGKFRDPSVLGMADDTDKKIVLSRLALDYNESDKLAILLEEAIHLKTGYSDRTTEFQSFVLSKYADELAIKHKGIA